MGFQPLDGLYSLKNQSNKEILAPQKLVSHSDLFNVQNPIGEFFNFFYFVGFNNINSNNNNSTN